MMLNKELSSPANLMNQTEVFTEAEWEDAQMARQKRDERVAQLQAQGYFCTAENLQTIHTGQWLYVVRASLPEQQIEKTDSEASAATRPKLAPQRKPKPASFETR